MTRFGQRSRVNGFTISLSAVHDMEFGVNDVCTAASPRPLPGTVALV